MKSLGKYEIVRELGHGGMGVVYLARDTVIGRDVAIKVIQEHAMQMPEIRDRLHREARSAGRLTHENIMTLYDFGQEGEQSYLVMELLDGVDLSEVISEERPMTLPRKLEIALQICRGLHYAHSRSVIHRDIKPGNIRLLESGRVKIVDFGIARLGSEPGTLTHTSMGTPRYMSPEQIKGEPIDPRTDVFSFGVLFYELLTGVNPFPGDSVYSEIYNVLNVEAEPLDLADHALTDNLQRLVSHCIAKDREQRCESFEVLVGEIEKLIEQCWTTETDVGALIGAGKSGPPRRTGAATVVDPGADEPGTIVDPEPGDGAAILGPSAGDAATIMQPEQDKAATIMQPQQDDAATIMQPQQDDAATIMQPQQDEAATIMQPQQDEAATIMQPQQDEAATIMHAEPGDAATIMHPGPEKAATTPRDDAAEVAAVHAAHDGVTPDPPAESTSEATEESAGPDDSIPEPSTATPKSRSRRPLWLGTGLAATIVAVVGFVWMIGLDDLPPSERPAAGSESQAESGSAGSLSDVAHLDAQPEPSAPEAAATPQEDDSDETTDQAPRANDDPVNVDQLVNANEPVDGNESVNADEPRLATPSLNLTQQPSPAPERQTENQGESPATRDPARRNDAARSGAATAEAAMDAARGPLAAYADEDCARDRFNRGEDHRRRGHELSGRGDFQGAATAFAAAETEFARLAGSMTGRDEAVRTRDLMNMARYRISDPSIRAVSSEYRDAESLRDRGETEFSACDFASATHTFDEAERLYAQVESPDQPAPAPESRPVADIVQEQSDRLLALLETAMMQGNWSAIPAPVSDYYKRQFDRLRSKHDILEVSVGQEPPQVAGSGATLPVVVDITHQQKGTDNVNVISIRKSWSWEVTDNQATVAAVLDP